MKCSYRHRLSQLPHQRDESIKNMYSYVLWRIVWENNDAGASVLQTPFFGNSSDTRKSTVQSLGSNNPWENPNR